MESSLVSWQVENFSSAELVSPPVSPAPQSPTLYNGAPLSLDTNTIGKSFDIISAHNIAPMSSSKISSRAQMASNLLNHLEQFESLKTEINDFEMNWNEESVNLGLFEELSEIEYTPPASPKRSINLNNNSSHHQLTEYSIAEEHLLPSEDPSALSALTAEFQAILESLPKDNTDALGHVLEIAGIPTTVIDGEALVPIEMDLTYLTEDIQQALGMEIEDVKVNVIDETDVEIIDESELYDLSSISNQGSPDSIYSNSINEDEDDHQANNAEKILDALLLGDISTAESFLPVMHDDSSMSSQGSEIAVIQYVPTTSTSSRKATTTTASTSTSAAASIAKKPERRGRKPGNKSSKGFIKDKSIRKKEQNKTAATRYRQKKKMEVALTLEAEAELQKEQDDLVKQKDDLHRQIVMVKQLLREVVNARKPNQGQGKSVVTGGGITVSSVVARNRRK